MAELESILETLKLQRKNLEDMIEGTAARRGKAAELVGEIEDLRRRAEETQRRARASATESNSKEKK